VYTQLLPINPTQIPEESSAREHLRMRFYIFLPMAKTLGECYHQNTKMIPGVGLPQTLQRIVLTTALPLPPQPASAVTDRKEHAPLLFP